MRGFAIAFVFAIAVFETQNRSPEKTLNFVMFSQFLTHPLVHHTNYCGSGGNGDSDCGNGDSNGSSSGDGNSNGSNNGGNIDGGARDEDNGSDSDGRGHRQQSTKRGSRRDDTCGDGWRWTTKARKIGWRTTMGKG
jgi:hypothetical protein